MSTNEVIEELKAEIIKEIGIHKLAAKLAPNVMQKVESGLMNELDSWDFSDLMYDITSAIQDDITKMVAAQIKEAITAIKAKKAAAK